MKKITSGIVALLLLSSLLFFACKKEKPETCGAELAIKATAFEAKAIAFQKKSQTGGYNKPECAALRVEAVALIAEVKACPQTSSNAELIAELDELEAEFICP